MENAFGQPQNVVVFGGTSDIARAILDKLVAARTRSIVLAGRNKDLLEQASAALVAGGATSVATTIFDANEPSMARAAVTDAFAQMSGPVDLVLVAVGLLGTQHDDENDADAAARMAAVNFSWPVAALAEIRRRLVAQGSGRIVVLGSVAAVRVRRNNYLYSGTKAGLDRLCEGMADSLIGTGVSMLIVRPGFVRSKMTAGMKEAPLSVDVDHVADDVMTALARRSRSVYSPKALGYVFLLLRHLPAPLWRKVTENA